jgi:mono/diheme cytochrome c family protein
MREIFSRRGVVATTVRLHVERREVTMRIKKDHWQCSLLAAVMFAVGLGAHVAQSAGRQRQTPEVKAVPYAAIQSVEGRENFTAYCAVCHGVDGRGNGPAAPAMKVPVPDLTTLAARTIAALTPRPWSMSSGERRRWRHQRTVRQRCQSGGVYLLLCLPISRSRACE